MNPPPTVSTGTTGTKGCPLPCQTAQEDRCRCECHGKGHKKQEQLKIEKEEAESSLQSRQPFAAGVAPSLAASGGATFFFNLPQAGVEKK